MIRTEAEAKILAPVTIILICLAIAVAGCRFDWSWPILAIASILIALCLCVRKARDGEAIRGQTIIALLLAILAMHIVQTIPVSDRLAKVFSPVAWDFWETLGTGGERPITASVKETRDAMLKFSACIAAFLIGANLFTERKSARLLAGGVFVTASILSAYGLHVLLLRPALTFFGTPVYDWNRLSGAYTNANRFCGLLEMALPLGIAILLESRSIGSGNRSSNGGIHSTIAICDPGPTGKSRNWTDEVAVSRTWNVRDAGWREIILVAAIALAALALLLTQSRLGIIGFAAGGFAAMWFAGEVRTSIRKAWPWLALASAAAMILALAYGIEDAIGRFASAGEGDLERRRICWAAALAIAHDHPILGCGAGAFKSIFPYYQPVGLQGYWNYAHSDWLSVPSELGAIGAAAAAAGIALWLRTIIPAAWGSGWLFACMLWGVFAILTHSLGDSPAMEPANAFLFFLLGGAAMGMGEAGRDAPQAAAGPGATAPETERPAAGDRGGEGSDAAPSEAAAHDAEAGGGGREAAEAERPGMRTLAAVPSAFRRWAPVALTGAMAAAFIPVCAGVVAAHAVFPPGRWDGGEGAAAGAGGTIEAARKAIRFDPCSNRAMKTLAVDLLRVADEAAADGRAGTAARMRNEAAGLLRRALWVEPLDYAAWHIMGAAAFREGRTPEAIAMMMRSARAARAWPGPAAVLAEMRLAVWAGGGRVDESLLASGLGSFRSSAEADPDFIGRALAACARYGVPPSRWREAIPAKTDSLRALASALIAAGASAEAEAVAAEALAGASSNEAPAFLLLRGEAALLGGDAGVGCGALTEAVASAPSDCRGAVAARADAILKERANAAARLAWWEETARRHGADAWAHKGLGTILLQLGRPADAIQPLKTAADISGDFESHMLLARAYAAAGAYGSASTALDHAAGMKPDDMGMLELKARVLEAQGYYAAAADVLERLAVLDAGKRAERREDVLRLRELARRRKEENRIAR